LIVWDAAGEENGICNKRPLDDLGIFEISAYMLKQSAVVETVHSSASMEVVEREENPRDRDVIRGTRERTLALP
jgi:hypothetical protein